MTALGLWKPYIDEPQMQGWYRLPDGMAAECRAYRPDGHELDALSARQYEQLHRKAVAFAKASVAPFRPAYHNDDMHFAETEAHGLAAADAYAGGDKRKMPPLVRQGLALALRTHDAHHCASTFRIEATRGMYRPELGAKVSSEWVTALSVNQFMQQSGLNLPARLFQTYIIWSSTYGGGTQTGRRLGIPNPQPRTVWGAIMRAADACPPPAFGHWLRRTIAVNYGETPAQPAPRTLSGFVEHGRGFMDYVTQCFDRLDTLAGSALTQRLGWRDRIANNRRSLDRLAGGDRKLVAAVQAGAGKYGPTLS